MDLFQPPEAYQSELTRSYHKFLDGGGCLSRYSKDNNVYEVRDANPTDVAHIALRDGELGSLFLNSGDLVQRVVSLPQSPDVSIGFCLLEKSEEEPNMLKIAYRYVSPEYRGRGISSIEGIDAVLSALEMEGINAVTAVQANRKKPSSFYESLRGILSKSMYGKFPLYRIDLSARDLAKKVIDECQKRLGIKKF